MTKKPSFYFVLVLFFLTFGCSQRDSVTLAGRKEGNLKVVATTTIVGDVVSNVGGMHIDLKILLPRGVDPHSFSPAPKDISAVADADIVFINGIGLEEFIDDLLVNADGDAQIVSVSEGVNLLKFGEVESFQARDTEEETDPQFSHDPHVWFDPTNVVIWVDNIVRYLSEQDSGNASNYQFNGEAYIQMLRELDRWTEVQTSQIALSDRILVTDHDSFSYFAQRYQFKIVGTIIPGLSTAAETSAQDLAKLIDRIRELKTKALFVGYGVNASVVFRVAEDTDTELVPLYIGSLSERGGPASTYLDLMRYDVNRIVEVLK